MVKKTESERPNINRIKEEWEKISKDPPAQLKNQAAGQMKVSDQTITSAISSGLFKLIATFEGNSSPMISLIELGNGHIASGHCNGQIQRCANRSFFRHNQLRLRLVFIFIFYNRLGLRLITLTRL